MAVYIDIIQDDIIIYGQDILDILLKDRTTGQNIIWATNDYKELGEGYEASAEITSNLIKRGNSIVIKPRIAKEHLKKANRTKDKAEVFTPSWICNEQNNLIDAQWFERDNVFNIQHDKAWTTNTKAIEFSNKKGKRWTDYVDARRMEIACGEAPYLCSRYDTVTGKTIKIQDRIGLLDRKIRVINENVNEEKEWLKWVERAFQSTYGYEYQGDNLLLARENLLYTFIENLKYKLHREPTQNELKKFATIISWNIWQMDGTNYAVPYEDIRQRNEQISMFDDIENLVDKEENKLCKIKDWRSRKVIEFAFVVRGEE